MTMVGALCSVLDQLPAPCIHGCELNCLRYLFVNSVNKRLQINSCTEQAKANTFSTILFRMICRGGKIMVFLSLLHNTQ